MLPTDIKEIVCQALAEDIGTGDLTAKLIPGSKQADAHVITRDDAILCGTAWFDEVFHQLDSTITIEWHANDSDSIQSGQTICQVRGPARSVLSGERMALNFLQLLSGTATQTRRYVDAINGTQAKILDTRKTLPALRNAQKYAVTCGGGYNHRMGLYDGILIKENHILAAGSITRAVQQAKATAPAGVMIEVEVEDLAEIKEARAVGSERLLLDNFDLETLRIAVAETRGRAKVEASGGITLENIRAVAETGVDYISIGVLTKDVVAVDYSMRFDAA
ncbi:MAG: carboxylating nicotinate-nucleotide diphosphorylase [Proteobacteria bacterium]|nr:MAG: carboxylating nicotinate-nucleotide diphosphorylase [Pseudomonadota bacterium]TDJ71875.1 MAG: carboxylating nicotinate-nucleotide diphosphorylase [Pseudomonadota bacterium]